MSASLVGSEMCIRDRSSSVPWNPTTWRPRVLGPGRARRALRLAGAARRAVACTHLTLPTMCSV
eukprot:6994199-Alexandrium_andersonii.AAC.1